MNRRALLRSLPALAAASRLHGQPHARCRLRAGLVAYTFRKQLAAHALSYEDLIRYVAGLGLDGLDTTVYWFPDTSAAFLAKLRQTAYRNAVSLYSVAARIRLCQPTPELQTTEVETAKKWIDVAERLGAGHVRVFGGSVPKGVSEPQAIAWAAEVGKRAAEYAGQRGIVLGIEDDGGLSATAEPTIAIIQQVDSPFLRMNLDTGNFPRNGYAQVELSIPYAANVHFKSHISGADGAKQPADWNRLLGLFAKAGYQGYLSLEYEDTADTETAVPKLAAELRRLTRQYSA